MGVVIGVVAALAAVGVLGASVVIWRRSEAMAAHAHEQARLHVRRFEAAADACTDMILLVGRDEQVRFANRASQARLGYHGEELLERRFDRLLHGDSAVAYRAAVARARGGDGRQAVSLDLVEHTGAVFHVDGHIEETGDDEDAAAVLIVLADVTARRRLDHLKDEFMATVSHELKTPLTSIRGALALMLSGKHGEMSDTLREMVEIAHRGTDRLGTLVKNLSDMEQMATGKIAYHLRPVEMLEVVDAAIATARPMLDRQRVGVRFEERPGEARVSGDARRLEQVIVNLLVNAAKYSKPDTHIEVGVTHEGRWVRVSVRDFGAGIPAEFKDRAFDRFSQADTSITRTGQGVGLGLAIAKSIVDAHGGRIDYESKVGEGTTFRVDVPEWRGSGAYEAARRPE